MMAIFNKYFNKEDEFDGDGENRSMQDEVRGKHCLSRSGLIYWYVLGVFIFIIFFPRLRGLG
jgi:hypothetical protein